MNSRRFVRILILFLLFIAVIIYYETRTTVYDCSIVLLQENIPKEVLDECEKLRQEEINEMIDWYHNNRSLIRV
jgi:hypothetical protein